jgi:ribonuclease J
MKIRIHRGAHEVGGNCVELVADEGTRIVLDAGYPLDDAVRKSIAPPVFDGPLTAAIITHAHLDHYGFAPDLGAPIYLGAEAERVLNSSAFFSPMTRPLAPIGHLRDREPFAVGAFTITPFLADHSAFDAYSLLVEADGSRLFYTGDFRGHGRKARLFEDLLAWPPRNIDVLMTEGTQIGGSDLGVATETELERELADLCADTEGLVVVLGSAQNLDRLVTAFRAAKRSGRTFVTDLYAATIATAVKKTAEFSRVAAIREHRVYAEQIAAAPGAHLMYVPSSAAAELIAAGALAENGLTLWSMWDGYLAEPSGQRLINELAAVGVPFNSLHTSGHATPADIKRLIDALDPRAVVPIHTDQPERFADLSERTIVRPDGEWWSP